MWVVQTDGQAGVLAERHQGQAIGEGHIKMKDRIDCFVCVHDRQREEYTLKVLAYWVRQHEAGKVSLNVLIPPEAGREAPVPKWLNLPSKVGINVGHVFFNEGNSFNRARRMVSHTLATTPWYIVADDDCLPVGLTFIDRAMKLIAEKGEELKFGVLSAWIGNAKIYPWRPLASEYEKPILTPEFMEHVDVGGIRFMNAAAHPRDEEEWDAQKKMDSDGKFRYDRTHAEMLRRKGYRVGYMRDVICTHLGENERHDTDEPDFEV